MNITLWEIVIWITLGICSFYVGRTTSYNKDIWIAHEALYHIDDDDYKFDGVKIYFPFLIFLIVNVVVNTLIYIYIYISCRWYEFTATTWTIVCLCVFNRYDFNNNFNSKESNRAYIL